jgi:hypothetical protein
MDRSKFPRAAIAGLLAGTVLSASAPAAQPCYPKQTLCGTEPLTYQCPPCPPGSVHLALPAKDQAYREAVEAYSEELEPNSAVPKSDPVVHYEKALEKYNDVLSTYKDAVEATSDEPK